MEITIFLAKVIGWYYVIASLFLLVRQQSLKTVMLDILADRALLCFIAVVTVILGLLLVISHNIWVMGWPVIITLIAWLILIGGVFRLFVPELAIKIGQWWLKNSTYLIIIDIACFVIGIYLLYRAYFSH